LRTATQNQCQENSTAIPPSSTKRLSKNGKGKGVRKRKNSTSGRGGGGNCCPSPSSLPSASNRLPSKTKRKVTGKRKQFLQEKKNHRHPYHQAVSQLSYGYSNPPSQNRRSHVIPHYYPHQMIKQESKKKNKKREEKATNGTGIEEMKITKKYKQL
jgi:hypothetical protein